jgi:hypothetical protein
MKSSNIVINSLVRATRPSNFIHLVPNIFIILSKEILRSSSLLNISPSFSYFLFLRFMFSLCLCAHTASLYIVYIVCTLLSSTEFCNRSWLCCYQVSSTSWVCGLVCKLVAPSCDVTSAHSTRSAPRKVKFVRGKPINTVC